MIIISNDNDPTNEIALSNDTALSNDKGLSKDIIDGMAFWEGVLAGYGIAIPVGAIAILIIDHALQKGFTSGFMAGAGAATVDLFYAAVAVLAGAALITVLSPYSLVLKIAASVVLIGLGSYGIFKVWRLREQPLGEAKKVGDRGYAAVYARFFGLTLLNPLTIVYFSALIIGMGDQIAWSGSEKLAFLIGAGLASLSWQSLLAAAGAAARRFLSPRLRVTISVFGNLLVIVLGLRIILLM